MIKLVQYHFVPYIFVYEAKLEIQFNNHQVPPSLILHIHVGLICFGCL